VLTTADTVSTEIISMSFAPGYEHKYIVTLSGGPDYAVTLWHWERPKILAQIKLQSGPLYQISFNAVDYQNGIFVSGRGKDKLFWFKYQNAGLVQLPIGLNKLDPKLSTDYICHAWMPDGRLVIGTDNGEIIIFDSACEFRGYVTVGLDNWRVECILPYSRGFLVAGEDASVHIFERHPEDIRNQYQRLPRALVIAEHITRTIKAITLSPNEDQLVCALDNSQMYYMPFNSDRPGEDTQFAHWANFWH
jgi:WD40 repeat protein